MKQMNEQLTSFIDKARAAGKGPDQIRELLLSSGWSAEQVAPFLNQGSDLVPPPPPAPRSSGREIFFYLLGFFTLGISAVSLGGIIFSLINASFPDATVPMYYQPQGVGLSALAAFLVAAPVYLAVSWQLLKDLKTGATTSRSGIRRVLTYIALFIASATVIGDIIALVYQFLAGEVNTRFLLKVLTILLLGGWIIWYYWFTLKRDERSDGYPARWNRSHGIVFGVVSLAAVVAAFLVAGGPWEQQRYVRDQRRISDLQSLHYSIQSYYELEQAMPASLDQLNQGYSPIVPQDPITGGNYEYVPGEVSAFQLCAEFETADPADSYAKMARPVYGPYDVNWSHPVGRYCFELEAKRPTL